jgi:hypothetical protein
MLSNVFVIYNNKCLAEEVEYDPIGVILIDIVREQQFQVDQFYQKLVKRKTLLMAQRGQSMGE